MDESLQDIFRVRPLQESINAYRNVHDCYRRMLKESSISEMKNLVNLT